MTEIDSRRPFLTTVGRRLTQAQLNRRRLMQGLLASGAYATIAGMGRGVSAQGTPAAAPFSGELAAEQVMRLPTTEPTTMDPGVSYGDDEILIFFNIFDGLVGVDQQTGEVVPRVAESWESNEDATEFTFHLRSGVTWSDGTPLNANDFVYSWKRVLDPNTLSEYTGAMYPVKNAQKIEAGELELDELGVVAVDELTLKVTLEGPTTYFPLLATTWTFVPVPKHVIDEHAEQWVEAENIVSNGPFIMTEWTHDQQIVLEANPNYYGDKPTLTRAEYRIFADPGAQAYVAYENDELDYCAPTGPDLDRVVADPEASKEVLTFQLSNCYFIVCDCTNTPTDKVEFRQALSKALDRNTLAGSVLNGQYLPAFSLLPDNIPGHNAEATLPENVDDAKQLLTTAGIDPSSVELELVHVNLSFNTTVAQYLQAAWQDGLGITVKLSPIEDATYSDWRASRETQPFNVYTGSWGSDFADASNWFNQNFTTQSDHYRNHWSYPEFDTLVATAAVNTNIDERNQQYSQAEAMLIEQAPIIPMVRGEAFRVIKPYVKDIYFQPVLSLVHLRTIKIAAH